MPNVAIDFSDLEAEPESIRMFSTRKFCPKLPKDSQIFTGPKQAEIIKSPQILQ